MDATWLTKGLTAGALVLGMISVPSAASAAAGAAVRPADGTAASCRLGNRESPVKHVIYMQFDNVH